jgi:MoaA/NifB/PqqE/SkfB family radical SAM enzyme
MNSNKTFWAEVDEQGRLVFPAELVSRYGLKPGARLRIDEETNSVRLHRPVSHLAKIYIEPTNRCNITCRTCMRNTWDEPMGMMREETFARIIEGLRAIGSNSTIMFAGIGEPLFHPRIVEMVSRAKALGANVELITNGTLLTNECSHQLVDAGLDVLWVSLDGATPESYADVRLGAALPEVIENLAYFRTIRKGFYQPKPEIGIAFVAMKRNIDDLPKVIALGRSVGATRFFVSNVLPYTSEMREEILYTRTLKDIAYLSSVWLPRLTLPKVDINESTREAFFSALRSGCSVTFAGNNLSGANDVCTFVESGAMAIGWDGSVSPCPPLLHNHTTFLRARKRILRRHIIGNVAERDLTDLWNDPDYVAYRERVQGFAFPPCTFCGGCELLDANEEDCLGNHFPVCGGCLWAQGVIACP